MAEEYASVVRKYLNAAIYGISLAYLVLMVDGLPLRQCAIGVVAHVSYLPLLSTFPFVEPISLPTIGGFLVTIGNHASWFYWFINEWKHHPSSDNQTYPGWRVLGFLFIFVWVVPIGFFISLTSMEESLPAMSPAAGNRGRKKKGIFKGFIDSVLDKKEQMFPGAQKRYY